MIATATAICTARGIPGSTPASASSGKASAAASIENRYACRLEVRSAKRLKSGTHATAAAIAIATSQRPVSQEPFGKRELSRNARLLRPSPHAEDADVAKDQRERRHRQSHPLEANVISQDVTADESHRRADYAEVHLVRLQAYAFGARGCELRQQRLVRRPRHRLEEEEELEHTEEVDGGQRCARVRRRREEEKRK